MTSILETAEPSVVKALSAVMEDVQAVGKTGRNTHQNYNFRGVDAVVNAVGPALRAHGVVVVPIASEVVTERYQTSNGAAMKGVTATVTFRFYGPAGDHIDAQVCGESSDSGDKAVPKAHSVAYRTMLLQALCIPTDEPDPDADSHERGDVLGLQSSRADNVIHSGDPGDAVLTFGKHKDKTIREVADADRPYLEWWVAQDAPANPALIELRQAVQTFLTGELAPVGGGNLDDIPFQRTFA